MQAHSPHISSPPLSLPLPLPLLSVLAHGAKTAGAASRACAKGVNCGNPAFIRNVMGEYYPGMYGGSEGWREGEREKGRVFLRQISRLDRFVPFVSDLLMFCFAL